jgi:osmoprotectant transport system permease protein
MNTVSADNEFNFVGLGKLLFDGIQINRCDKIVVGAIAVAVLALVINRLLLALEHYAQPQRRLKQE